MQINGIAHIQLSVRRFEECAVFYEKLLPFFEMTLLYRNSDYLYYIGGKLTRTPQYHEDWAPGYYSILFEDPDGIPIEANHVPGKGNLENQVPLPKDWSRYET